MNSVYRAGLEGVPHPAAEGVRMMASGMARGRSPSAIYGIGTGRIVIGGVGDDVVSLLMSVAHVLLILVGLNVLVNSF